VENLITIKKNAQRNEFDIIFHGGFAGTFDMEIFSLEQVKAFVNKKWGSNGDTVQITVDESALPRANTKQFSADDFAKWYDKKFDLDKIRPNLRSMSEIVGLFKLSK